MQQIDPIREPLLDALVAHAAEAQQIGSQASTLRDWIERALASPLWERARRARRLWRELPFCIDCDGTITEGRIDLLFEEDEALVLVDYKTDAVDSAGLPAAIDAHRPQLAAYGRAIRQLTGREPHESWLYLVRSGVARQL
jgi:ATP-dependent helicase/nuclease subunit A